MNGFGTNLSRLPSHSFDLNGVSSGTTILLANVLASPLSKALAFSFSSVSGSSPMPCIIDLSGSIRKFEDEDNGAATAEAEDSLKWVPVDCSTSFANQLPKLSSPL